jgi:hypothetical protein
MELALLIENDSHPPEAHFATLNTAAEKKRKIYHEEMKDTTRLRFPLRQGYGATRKLRRGREEKEFLEKENIKVTTDRHGFEILD